MTMMQTFYIAFVFEVFSLTGATESGIVHGRISKPHSRPYMASLQVRGHHTCGGILVREDFVLTAGHCRDQSMKVVLGAHNIKKKEKSQQSIPVAAFYPHPEFNINSFAYDLMLLKLKNNATLNKYVKTIGLPKKAGKTPANVDCVVAGWGRTGPQQESSDVLREAREKIQFSFECNNIWKDVFKSNQMLCTKFDMKKGGICQGDSGGPLICNSKPQGITAFTAKDKCNDTKIPHVFMKIEFFLPWIKKVMQRYGNDS